MGIDLKKLREGCEKSFALFCLTMQDEGWFDEVHERICNEVQQELETSGVLPFLRGENTSPEKLHALYQTKIAVVMPRGSLKSTIITKYLSIWLVLQDCNLRGLIATNSADNGTKKIQDIQGVFESNELFRSMWPELLPKRNDVWNTEGACVNRLKQFPESTFERAGVKTRVIGRHYDFIIEDDTVAPDESDLGKEVSMPSIEDIEKATAWHKLAVGLFNPKGIRVRIVVTTRWSDFDLIDYIKKEENYKIIDVPAIDEATGQCNFSNFYQKDVLDNIAKDLGPYMFSALYLNKPISAGDRIFEKDWIQYIDLTDSGGVSVIPADSQYVVTVDPAISQRDDACESAIIGCFQHRDMLYVTDCFHKKYTPSEMISLTVDLVVRNLEKTKCIVIEGNAYQKSLKYSFEDEMKRRGIFKPIICQENRTPKHERIQGLQPLFANKQILLKKGISKAIENQLLQFPHGRLVDVIDCLAMQLKVYRGTRRKEALVPEKKDESRTYWYELEKLRKKANTKSIDKFSPVTSLYGIDVFDKLEQRYA